MVFAQLGIHRRIQRTAKVSKSEGVLFQNKLFGTRPRNPRNPRNPRKWCHDLLLGTSPTRAGGQDDVSSQANSLKLAKPDSENTPRRSKAVLESAGTRRSSLALPSSSRSYTQSIVFVAKRASMVPFEHPLSQNGFC